MPIRFFVTIIEKELLLIKENILKRGFFSHSSFGTSFSNSELVGAGLDSEEVGYWNSI